MSVSIEEKEEEGKKGKGGRRRCRGESMGWLEGRDDDQPNFSQSKKLKSCTVDLLWVREKCVWGEGNPGMPFSPSAKITISMSKAAFEACFCGFDPRSSCSSFILLFSVLPWREP